MKIAIIGSGVSGLVAARHLDPDHEVTVFEADSRVGGHANTVDVTVDGRDHAVDTGFIVYNEQNYPGFVSVLRELGVATQPTDMSFGIADAETGLEFRATNLNTLFAQRRNIVNLPYLRLLAEIVRFNRNARALADTVGVAGDESLAEFVRRGGYSDALVRQFLVPLGASVWSADPETFTEFPAYAYARFMQNHGLLQTFGRPRWRTVTGGSRSYVDALVGSLRGRVRTATPVHKVSAAAPSSGGTQVEILTDRGPETFDRVVIATHSDQALRMLADATPGERSILGAIRYEPNTTTLHTDARVLPSNPRAHASWNYFISRDSRHTTVTYSMNRLQSIDSSRPLLVTLNRREAIDDRQVLAEFDYSHPVFDVAAFAAQRRWSEIQGKRGIYFAGAYWGYGFHEDGVQSAKAIVAAIEGER